MRTAWLPILFILSAAIGAAAQQGEWDNRRLMTVAPAAAPLLLDSLEVIYSTLEVEALPGGQRLDTAYYRLEGKQLYFLPPALAFDSLRLRFRVLPYDLGQPQRRLDTARTASAEGGAYGGILYNPYAQQESILDFKGLNYSGNFTRGISFGNNQDLVLNSSFNLQLAGELGDGVEVLAAITDENIPLQPEGNTRQLREFDRIFIQLKKGNSQLIAGDYELPRPNSYFMNYFKKLQGATFSNTAELGEGQLTSTASLAISRGQFNRQLIVALEGNQGPYRLRGAQGERFIIVLSGTEKVFFDGALLQRGLEEDYVIDYNRGEVTFTNKRLITKDSRIAVEFEYSDQNYVRSLYAAGTAYEKGKLRLDFNFLNQQDSKNATGELGLTDEQKRILSLAGDQFSAAVVPSLDTLPEFVPFRVSYQLVDTLLECFPDTAWQFLRFSTDPELARYTARFSFVGPGAGQYVLDETQAANERAYRWVGFGPDCQPLGDFEPVVQLIPPRQQQMITLGGHYAFSPRSGATAEVALSRLDLNRFSRLDSDDDLGLSAYTDFNHLFKLGRDSSGWELGTKFSYEWVQATFQPLNPYRNPEFLRDWNLANVQGVGEVAPAQEQLGIASLALQKAGLGSLAYSFSGFLRDSLYAGMRHNARLRSLHPQWEVDVDASLLSAETPEQRSSFQRPRGTLARTFPQWKQAKIGFFGEQEKSRRFAEGEAALEASSFYFDRYRFFFEGPQSEALRFGASFSQRFDYAPVEAEFEREATATEANVNGAWQWRRKQTRLNLAGNLTYRKLNIDKPGFSALEPGETFLGRSDLNLNLAKGAVQSATTYEIGSGQEPKVEFTFVRVRPGEGTHIWLDSLYNNDGIIQPNEMELAPFQDLADYVRITTITDDFIRTDDVNLNQSLRLNPKAVWFNKTGARKLLSRFSTLSTLAIKRKTQPSEGISPWNPFQLDVADTALVAVSSNMRHVLFFNQANPVYDFQLSSSDNRNKFVQTTGFESRRNSELSLQGRWNITRTLSTKLALAQGLRLSDSEFFDARDFFIEYANLAPELSYLPSRNFRATLRYQYQQDENTLEKGEGENSQRHDFSLEARYNQSAKSSLQLRTSFVKVDFEGNPNSPVGFAILNGLQRGQNFLWNLSLDRQLARNIQLRISYEGRKTGLARVIHTGRAQVAANF